MQVSQELAFNWLRLWGGDNIKINKSQTSFPEPATLAASIKHSAFLQGKGVQSLGVPSALRMPRHRVLDADWRPLTEVIILCRLRWLGYAILYLSIAHLFLFFLHELGKAKRGAAVVRLHLGLEAWRSWRRSCHRLTHSKIVIEVVGWRRWKMWLRMEVSDANAVGITVKTNLKTNLKDHKICTVKTSKNACFLDINFSSCVLAHLASRQSYIDASTLGPWLFSNW